mgnify:CR=1 FL=1
MEHQLRIGMEAGANLLSQRAALAALLMQSLWDVECYGPDGKLKWVSLENPNVMTNEGLNHLLDVLLHLI